MFRIRYSFVRLAGRLSSPGSACDAGSRDRLNRRALRVGAVVAGAVALLFYVSPAAIHADFREAARKLVPATVVITRVEPPEKKGDPRSTTTPLAATPTPAPQANNEGGKAEAYWVPANPPTGLQLGFNPGPDAVNVWCGVLISPDGWIVTTSSGPAKAELEVRLADGRVFPARLVVDDHRTGLWLLKAGPAGAPFVSPAITPVELGQDVISAMADGPKSRQIARGIVTALNRHVDGIPLPLILTDLPMREAAAGAPVCNAAGELIGLVSARGQGNDKHALVVTAAYVKDLLASRRDGAVTTVEPGMLGISLREAEGGKLMMVNGVSGGSPADKAGLQKGDLVDSIDGRQFASPEELIEYVGMKSPGSAVVVKYRRGEKDLVAAAVLAARPMPTITADFLTSQPLNLVLTNPITDVTLTNPNYGVFVTTPDNGLTTTKTNGPPNSDPKSQLILGWLAPSQAAPQAPVVRVEKTEVEKRIDELRRDIGALTSGIDSIRSHLDKLGADVKALSESRNKK
jgi:S1-C subfamily serine protease